MMVSVPLAVAVLRTASPSCFHSIPLRRAAHLQAKQDDDLVETMILDAYVLDFTAARQTN